MFGIADVEAARGRIADATRRTPIWKVDKLKHSPIPDGAALWLKLGAASVAAPFNGSVKIRPGENVCALVCGAGRDGWA
jgi:hypothetical protein